MKHLTRKQRIIKAAGLIGRAQGAMMFNEAFRQPLDTGNVKAYLDHAHSLLMQAETKK